VRRKFNYEKLLYLNKIGNNNIVLDIGANKGYYTSLFSTLVGRYGEVHSFEPVPETYKELQNLKTRFENVFKNNLAVGRESCTATINYDPFDSEKATLLDTTLSLPKKYQTEVISIDEYVENLKLTFVHFIKCDVEGLELDVLRGAKNTLKTLKPKVSLEITLAENDLNEAIHLLKSAGYSNFHKIEKDYPLFDIKIHNYSEDYFYLYASC
jgi:FkbM family methyltransferase